MQLTPDYTIFLQIATFVVVWVALRALVFGPMHHALDDRDRRTVRAHHLAEELVAHAEGDRLRYEEAIHERRIEMTQQAEAARHAAIEESNREIAAARDVVAQELAAHRATVAAQIDAARRALAAEAEAIAAEMLARVTGRARA